MAYADEIGLHRAIVKQLGFEITDERGPALGPVLEVTVDSVEEAKLRLVGNGC